MMTKLVVTKVTCGNWISWGFICAYCSFIAELFLCGNHHICGNWISRGFIPFSCRNECIEVLLSFLLRVLAFMHSGSLSFIWGFWNQLYNNTTNNNVFFSWEWNRYCYGVCFCLYSTDLEVKSMRCEVNLKSASFPPPPKKIFLPNQCSELSIQLWRSCEISGWWVEQLEWPEVVV